MAKVFALLTGAVVLVAVTLGALWLGATLVDETLEFGNLLAMGVVLLSFTMAVGGYSVLLSAFAKDRGKPAGMAAGLTLAFYLAWVISGLSEDWEWLKNASIFTAFDPQAALETGDIDLFKLGALLAVGLVCTVAALAVFRWRDAAPS